MFDIFRGELTPSTARKILYAYVNGFFETIPEEIVVAARDYDSKSLSRTIATMMGDMQYRCLFKVEPNHISIFSDAIEHIRQSGLVCDTPVAKDSQYNEAGQKIDVYIGDYMYRKRCIDFGSHFSYYKMRGSIIITNDKMVRWEDNTPMGAKPNVLPFSFAEKVHFIISNRLDVRGISELINQN